VIALEVKVAPETLGIPVLNLRPSLSKLFPLNFQPVFLWKIFQGFSKM
jgi:hypothetical protein